MMFRPHFLALALAMLASACMQPASVQPTAELSTATAYVEAYNQRDLLGMLALMHDDVQWLSVEGDKVEVFANGKTDLASQMQDYLASPMATSSAIDGGVTNGRFVAVREIASWTDKEGNPKSQSALAIYEFEAGLVRRVWYYPAVR